MVGGSFGMLPIVVFFEEKIGSSRKESVCGGLLRRDDRDGMAVLGIETAEEVKHLTGFADGLPNVPERVSELLEFPGVLGNIHVALDEVGNLASR
jgi:hypothetical protein